MAKHDVGSEKQPGDFASGSDHTTEPQTTPYSKTPFYEASYASRYHRQELIREIQESQGSRLLCFVCGSLASMTRDDIVGFVDLLHNVPPESDVDLLLHTVGGDIDVAEKIVTVVRARVGTGRFRTVVPDFAKSAGTLLAVGSDSIVMSDTSELGPIDPQVTLSDANGNRIQHSVQNYLDAFETHSATLTKNPADVTAQIMIGKLDPSTVKLFQAVNGRALKIAEGHLIRGMFKYGGNSTKTARELLDTKRWQSHGQMISWQDAQDERLGLNVTYLAQDTPDWQAYWRLYCLQRLAIRDRGKLFESDFASLVMEVEG